MRWKAIGNLAYTAQLSGRGRLCLIYYVVYIKISLYFIDEHINGKTSASVPSHKSNANPNPVLLQFSFASDGVITNFTMYT